jgi:2-polyprenyl-3-methyl-5-hydroxy-6-metoxy-1,4-benzoquinol methylase
VRSGGHSGAPSLLSFPKGIMKPESAERVGMQTSPSLSTSRTCPCCGCADFEVRLRGPDRFHWRNEVFELLRCKSCSMVWLGNPPKPNQMPLHYGRDYDRFIASAGENTPDRWRARREVLAKYKSGGALLDLGCSTGTFLASLRGEGWELHGIEISPEVAKKAARTSGANVYIGDVLTTRLQPESFDAITCFDVLEHLYQPREVVQRAYQWLKPGGVLYVLVPNIDSWEARLFGSYWYGLELPRHLSHFSPASLRRLAASIGFEEISLVTHANSAFEYSCRYVYESLLGNLGLPQSPLATAKRSGVPWRAIRKLFRVAREPFTRLAPVMGAGESIHAVFAKRAAHLPPGAARLISSGPIDGRVMNLAR